ncbi:MAG: fumarylacetoacetate hydrolase family protein [Rhodothermales bacterium]|nr:fumarylacetoacetate hydrolase family protein [Rhodothermales bacterium]
MEINPSRLVTVPGNGKVSVGKVLCIGRNYARHAAEMNSPLPEVPMVFLKPATALTGPGTSVSVPPGIGEIHHEVELVALIGRRLTHASREEAAGAVTGWAVGLDMTARDVQARAKKAGHPWSVAKGYDSFAPLGRFASPAGFDAGNVTIRLSVNGRVVQEGNTADMIFDVPTLLSYCSTIFTLEPGDLLYTGTPEGVGPVQVGDRLHAEVEGLPPLEVGVTSG